MRRARPYLTVALLGLVFFSVGTAWGLGAVAAAFMLGGLYSQDVSEWLDR